MAWILSGYSPKAMEAFSEILTVIFYDALNVRKKIIFKNLRIAFGDSISEAERIRLARASFLNFMMTTLEFLRGYYVDIVRNTEIENADKLRDILDEGKGAFVLCMHMGNWEVMGASVSRLIAPAHVIVKAVGSKQVDNFVEAVRKTNGFVSIKRTKGTHHVREVFSALKQGEIVGFVMDQARPGENRIPFFSQPAKTNSGLAVLARKTRVPVVPGYTLRESFGRHRIYFLDPLELSFTDNIEEDIRSLSLHFNQSLEEIIRKKPEQYFWLHDRWK